MTTRDIEYTVRRSERARRVSVNVSAEAEIEVVLPQRAPERAAAAAVAELRPWIERRLAQVATVRQALAARAGTIPYLGRPLQLVSEPGRVIVRREGEKLLVPALEPRPAIERFYRRAARVEVASRLDAATAAVGLRYSALAIRGQRSRWASCSASGAMSFNWRLLLAPEQVLQYVVWHEVCHLQIRDHSPRFWALLQRRWPTWHEQRDWLRREGATLVL
jgi:predicted metal-dependent hydrolase